MSFSSLLPPPKHKSDAVHSLKTAGQIIVKALTDEDIDKDQPSDDENNLKEQYDKIASRVHLHDFMPLRQKDFNIEIPYPSHDEINETYNRTLSHFQKLTSQIRQDKKNVSNPQVETVLMPNGRRIHVTTKTNDPLQPNLAKRAKKIYAPSNEEEEIQPQLHVSSNSTGSDVTKQMKQDWHIPTFVSQWKNPKGYAISSRGESNGGESQEINAGFVELANALEEADREARLQLQLKREAKVIELNKSMREREEKLNKIAKEVRQHRPYIHKQERRKSLDKRDISNKIDLYQNKPSQSVKKTVVSYDSRLYAKGSAAKNRAENVYDNPLFAQQDIDSIYRVKYNQNKDGGDGENIMSNGPVEFSKAEKN